MSDCPLSPSAAYVKHRSQACSLAPSPVLRRAMHTARIQNLVRKLQRPPSGDNIFISSSYSGRVFIADQEEVNKICEDYQKLENKYDLFERMFIQLFLEEEIELSVHFGLDKLREDELRKDQRFRTHVGKFQRFFTGIVEMLSKGPEQLSNIVKFLAEKWLIFKNVLLSLLCRDNSEKSFSTWSKFISFVIYEIKDSYLEQVRHARSSSCPHIAELMLFRRPEQRTKSKSICAAKELLQE
ncbi:hypothetical protein TELCIR_18376 [Teladorsagia circumcincta]|uniref:Uncharacterized protein n=1 Tax=Teladorsagia circumcincta TaxID=45464 RepID=A0A2G9TQ68_TELCI|nr:hypothetical protein TELCIR_18376 [Teladorsagia circumcincta]